MRFIYFFCVWFKQLIRVFVQISEGSQRKEQVDRLFLMASQIVSEDCSDFGIFCFVNGAQCHGEFTKNHLLKDEAVLDLTAAASQTVSK